MTFREIFDQYQAGTATEEERRLVEEELEKTALLNEHLFGSWEEVTTEPPAGELKQVKKSLRRRNIVLVLTSVAVVIALLLSVPLVERVYFDPTQASWSEEKTDLEIALECYYSLFAPRQEFTGVERITDTGFASWALELSFWEKDSLGMNSYLTATVDQNEISFPRGALYYTPEGLFNMAPFVPNGDIWKESARENLLEDLQGVGENDLIYAAVSFAEDLNPEQLYRLWLDYGAEIYWAGVRVGRPEDPPQPLIGVDLRIGRYDCGVNRDYPELETIRVTVDNLEQHFRSMVRYCQDYEQDTMNIGVVEDPDYYDKVLAELDQNGMRFYGGFMYGKPEVYRKLVEAGYLTDTIILEVYDHITYAYDAPAFGG